MLSIILFIAGLVLLVLGAEVLVRGATQLARAMHVSPLVIGLTVVAYGTSAPELAVGVTSGLAGQPDVAIGNVVGSNIANVLLILGLSALVSPLIVSRQLIRVDVPLMVVVSVLVLLLSLDGRVSTLEGLVLVALAAVYSIATVRKSRKEGLAERDAAIEAGGTSAPSRTGKALLLDVALIVVGLLMLVLGSRWLVDSAVVFARLLGVDELVIGLTVVAVGTSLPEAAASIAAVVHGERDMAVGNVVGSNIFNLLLVLGAAAFVTPGGVPVAHAALTFDLPVMVAVAIACMPIFASGHHIARWEGAMFVAYFVAYVGYLVLDATGHHALPAYSAVMATFALPLTAVTLLVVGWRAAREHLARRRP